MQVPALTPLPRRSRPSQGPGRSLRRGCRPLATCCLHQVGASRRHAGLAADGALSLPAPSSAGLCCVDGAVVPGASLAAEGACRAGAVVPADGARVRCRPKAPRPLVQLPTNSSSSGSAGSCLALARRPAASHGTRWASLRCARTAASSMSGCGRRRCELAASGAPQQLGLR